MANMKQKSVDQRRTRRNRYINAIEPFRKKYKCAAKEVYDIIQGVEDRNSKLQNELNKTKEDLAYARKQNEEHTDKIEELTIKIGVLENVEA